MNDHGRKWAAGLRALILVKLQERGPQTTRDLANACQVSPAAIAPRMTELLKLGEVRDTGRRQSSVSGKGRKLKMWAAVDLAAVEGELSREEAKGAKEDESCAVMRLLE